MRSSIWKKIRNRGSSNLRDAGIIIGSSEITVRLRSFGNQHTLRNCAIQDREGSLELCGSAAEEQRGRLPDELTATRPFRNGRVEDLDACRELLKNILTESKHRVLFGPRLLIGVGSHLTELEKRTLREVAKAAGARRVELVRCAVLNVLGAGRDPFNARGQLVLDLGAGLGEISLVASGRVQYSQSVSELGYRLDQAIVDSLRDKERIEVSLEQAEEIKQRVASATPPEGSETIETFGRDTESSLPCRRTVSAELVHEAISPILAELAETVRQVLKEIPSGFVSDIAENGVLLVGGVACLNGLDRYLSNFTNLKFVKPKQPQKAAQKGLDQLLQDPDLRRNALGLTRRAKARSGSSTRTTEKLAGLLVVSLLLVASYYPADRLNQSTVWQSWSSALTPTLALFAPQTAAASSSEQDAVLAEQQRQIALLSQENSNLRRAKKLDTKPPSWAGKESLTAQVVARSPGSWKSNVMLNAGSAKGVTPGMTVTTARGLVGRVQRVTGNSSFVKLLDGETKQFAGSVTRTGTQGVVLPGKEDKLTLTYVDPNDGVRPGDTVTTNGLDGHFTAGVPVGKVARLYRDEDDSYLIAELEPLVEEDQLDNVLILDGVQRI